MREKKIKKNKETLKVHRNSDDDTTSIVGKILTKLIQQQQERSQTENKVDHTSRPKAS
jgi:hypothetical protein